MIDAKDFEDLAAELERFALASRSARLTESRCLQRGYLVGWSDAHRFAAAQIRILLAQAKESEQ